MSSGSIYSLCQPSTFSHAALGSHVLSVEASIIDHFSLSVPASLRFTAPASELVNATFCNVTVVYTHPGENDAVGVETWLPPSEDWNELFLGVGGGGFGAGRFNLSYATMAGFLADGYASVTTDAGLSNEYDPTPWALRSPGHVNTVLVNNFASRSLNEAAIIGKTVVRSFYGKKPLYSYYNGCSQGGRQGLELAQRYPTAYDGIAASAPAIHFVEAVSSMYWPQQYMNDIGKYPHICELNAITLAAISKCDGLDGITDGLVSDVDKCFATFDPFDLVGQSISCTETGSTITISADAASVVNASWTGIESTDGKSLWYGYRPGTDLTGTLDPSLFGAGSAATSCTGNVCTSSPNALGAEWYQLFAAKDPNFNVTSMSHSEFDRLYQLSLKEYPGFSSSDPDLSAFRDAGGKMITFHGLADSLIPDLGTVDYYDKVTKALPDVHDFYRYFPVPGLGHCFGGRGDSPIYLFEQLRAWVENGTAPDRSPVTFQDDSGKTQNRILCPYPLKATYQPKCGDSSKACCWSCA
ncbi:tannase and feruloyl esterase [Hypoxylon sp. NC1633]|nr:tannase and feruloyl esterase [Hypoxylon sp. NC1633]